MSAASKSTIFISALESLDGVGRVTARKIAKHWDDLPEFQKYPKEQVLVRLKGVSNASKLVDNLNNLDLMRSCLEEQARLIEANEKRQISLLSFKDDGWPDRLEEGVDTSPPNLIYGYGELELLKSSSVCILGRNGISSYAHEKAQVVVKHLHQKNITLSGPINSGFDVVLHKLSYDQSDPRPSIMGAVMGLAKTPREYRSHVSINIKSGGLFFSPFSPEHGPFDHDYSSAMETLIGISPVVVFVEPAGSPPQIELMRFAHKQRKAVFFISELPDDPSGVNAKHLGDDLSLDWVATAASLL